MNKRQRIQTLAALGERLSQPDDLLEAHKHRSCHNNPWFTLENQQLAIEAIRKAFLQRELLEAWAGNYSISENSLTTTVGLVVAGNIPLVGFHDLLCTFVAGHKAQIKLSEKDPYMLHYLIECLQQINPEASQYFEVVERLSGFDAVVATGSNNSARYFEYYFGKYPHIIRQNRNAVAVLHGAEKPEELKALGADIFRYFGLGCRNVSKLYVPRGYDFESLLNNLSRYSSLLLHDKYKNNYDYNLAVLLLNNTPHLNNGSLLLLENPGTASRIATVHYEYFDKWAVVEHRLQQTAREVQCVIGSSLLSDLGVALIPFGKSQEPSLFDYPDGVDVMEFLTALR